MDNLSEFGEDPFADLNTSDFAIHHSVKPSALERTMYIYSVITTIMKLGICLSTIGASIMLVYVIKKFEKLKTKPNEYLLHYGIANLIYFFFIPLFEIFNEITSVLRGGIEMYCIIFQIESASLFLMFSFATAIAFEWYILVYQCNWIQKYAYLQKYSILILYLIGILKCLINSGLCFHENTFFSNHILNVSYIVMTILILLINIQNYKYPNGQPKLKYLLIVSNFIICSWTPLFIYHCLFNFFYDDESEVMIVFLSMTDCIPEFLAFIHPVIVLFLLGRLNKHFKMAFDSLFKRWNYKIEDLDEVSDNDNDITTNGANSVQITTENSISEPNGVSVS